MLCVSISMWEIEITIFEQPHRRINGSSCPLARLPKLGLFLGEGVGEGARPEMICQLPVLRQSSTNYFSETSNTVYTESTERAFNWIGRVGIEGA